MIAVGLILVLALQSSGPVLEEGAIDLGNGACQEADGTPGAWEVGGQCITEADYAVLFGVENLVAQGVYEDVVDNGDGTVTVTLSGTGGYQQTVAADARERSVAYDPVAEPEFTFERYLGIVHSGARRVSVV